MRNNEANGVDKGESAVTHSFMLIMWPVEHNNRIRSTFMNVFYLHFSIHLVADNISVYRFLFVRAPFYVFISCAFTSSLDTTTR